MIDNSHIFQLFHTVLKYCVQPSMYIFLYISTLTYGAIIAILCHYKLKLTNWSHNGKQYQTQVARNDITTMRQGKIEIFR